MSLEYLEGYSNQGGSADVWILRDESGKIIAFTMQIFHKLLTHRSCRCVTIESENGGVFNTSDRKEKCYETDRLLHDRNLQV